MKYIIVTEVHETMDAEKTWQLDAEDAEVVTEWLQGQGLDPEDVITEYEDRFSPGVDIPRGYIQFGSGFQYNVVDQDLLGGNGDGAMEQKFESDTGYGFRLV